MHHATKKKFVTLKEQGATVAELRTAMEGAEIEKEEIEALITELYTDTDKDGNQTPHVEPGESPNNANPDHVTGTAEPILAEKAKKFDFGNLDDENFTAYEKYVDTLPAHEMVDFQRYRIKPIIKELYPGLDNSPKKMTGIRLVNTSPVDNARITPANAKELNNQARNSGFYYLLKQD